MTGPLHAWILVGGLVAVLASAAMSQVIQPRPIDCGKVDAAVCALVRDLNTRIGLLERRLEALETPRVQPLR